jgi:hypothetical protein
LQELAHTAKLSGVDAADIDQMAKLGSYGAQPGNISRDLMNKFCKSADLVTPLPYIAKVPMLVNKNNTEIVAECDHHFLLPTDWVESITRSEDPRVIEQVFNFDKVPAFWKNHRPEDPKLYKNPVTGVKDYNNKMTPVLLHGDGGQFQKRDSLNVISLHSVLSKVSAIFKFMLLTAVPKKCTSVDKTNPAMDTMFNIWKVLVWNMKAAFEGVHPKKDHNGNPWPAGSLREKKAGTQLYKGYALWLFGINPDMEYMQNEFGLNGASHDNCCWMCPANKTDIPFTDPGPLARWRKLKYTPRQNRTSAATRHQIMDIPGVVNETFCIETLHTNELGVVIHYIANVFYDQIYEKFVPGKNQDIQISNLWNTIQRIYADLKISSSDRINKLTMEMIRGKKTSDYPVLSKVKAKEARCLLPVAVKIMHDTLEKHPTSYNAHCAKAGQALLAMYEVMDKAYLHPDLEQRTSFREHCDTFQMRYATLAAISQKKGVKRWNTVPKFHYSAHSPDFFDFFNIKYTSAYGGETEIGLVCGLGHKCLDGTPAHKVSWKLHVKYRMGQHIRLTDNCEHPTLDHLDSDSDKD